MSGRIKQRTKGNTKPSSSGRAAELLSRDGFMGFVGFGDAGSSPDGSSLQFVPATTDNPEASVHSDFLVVMKKLSKRDAVTKLKAVQEFGELCKTGDMNAVLGVLKYWPRLYNKLALDIDYRVREATQHAMNQMTTRVGRNFAPHLKSVMGVWLCSQCDTYLPVATAAQNAFNASFTDSKQAEVLGFCKKEINEYLVDNLMDQTADTLSDADVVDEKDRAAKYVRVIASSMQALGKFLKMVDEDVRNEIAHHHTRLTSEKKFWKFGRHKSPQIKAAFFSLISTYCQKQPSILELCSTSVCPIVLGSLDEADAVVSGPLWEAVLQLVSNMKDCWKHVNMEKAVLPKFWQFLSNAAYGNAHVVMISVLPFISTLPEEVVSPRSGFAQKLLEKTLDGFKLNKTQQSISESKAVLSSFMDCVKYFVTFESRKWQVEINQDDVEQLKTHVINTLMNVVEMSLDPKTQMRGSSSFFYERLAEFLRGTTEMADIQDQFWQGFGKLIHDKTECLEKDTATTFQSIANLLSCLKTNQPFRESQPSRVRFQEPDNNDDERHKANTVTKRPTKASDVNLLYGGRLLATVSKTVCKSLERVWSQNSEADLILVTELLKEFFSTSLLKDILKIFRSFSKEEDLDETVFSDTSKLSNLSICCINELVLPLLKKIDRIASEKWTSCSVRLLFMLLTEVEEHDQKCLFERVFEMNSSPNLLYLIINEIFEAEYYLYLSYVHGNHIGTKFVAVLKSFLIRSCEETEDKNGEEYLWRTLELCFVHSGLLEFFFSEDSMSEIFHLFHLVLSQENQSASLNIVSVVKLVEKYFQNIEITANQVKNEAFLGEVLADIVQLKLQGSEQSLVSQCLGSLINTAINDSSWLDMVISQAAQQIKDFLCSNIPITFEKFAVFTDAAVEIIESLTESDNGNFGRIVAKLSPSESDWDELRTDTLAKSTWAVIPFLDGIVSFTEFPHTRRTTSSEHLTSHQMLCLFLSRVFKLRFEKECFPECEEADGNVWRILIEMLWLREHLKQTLYIKDGPSFRTPLDIMETNLQPLLDTLTNASSAAILRRLHAMSKSEGGVWSLTLKASISASLKKKKLSDILSDLLVCEKGDHSEQQLQTMQCLLQEDTSIYNLKLTVECYSKMLREIDSSDMTGLMYCLCILSSALERWIYLSQDSEIATMECQMTFLEVLKDVKSRQSEITDLLLFSCSLDDEDVSKISLNLAIMRIMRMAVVNYSENLESEMWDMILCSMLDWLQSCQDSDAVSIRVGAMTNHVCRLIEAVGTVLPKTTAEKKVEKDVNVSSSDARVNRCYRNLLMNGESSLVFQHLVISFACGHGLQRQIFPEINNSRCAIIGSVRPSHPLVVT
ncbi:E3 ubiquitin-protein ligase listerin-like [Dendronephthya gigantea]|uniref:E3 ubiquitin-protein ligase listerin-like n=1 Tax=Dendronephthya gigantea TaxID=151771 RepID=UPI00106A697A|nr:E3 ubiquitin-protein ligase listerin-like [Dendronephthya gigantea]